MNSDGLQKKKQQRKTHTLASLLQREITRSITPLLQSNPQSQQLISLVCIAYSPPHVPVRRAARMEREAKILSLIWKRYTAVMRDSTTARTCFTSHLARWAQACRRKEKITPLQLICMNLIMQRPGNPGLDLIGSNKCILMHDIEMKISYRLFYCFNSGVF